MISSMLVVEWILLVTACSFCWKPRRSVSAASCGRVPWSTLTIRILLCGTSRRGASGSFRWHPVNGSSALEASQLEHLVRFQHLRAPVRDPGRDLGHDRVGFARLQMRHVDLGLVTQLLE